MYLFFGWSLQVAAQSCLLTLEGTVRDAHDRSPMEDVNIYITEVGAEQWTDARGKFSFENLCPGTYHAQIQQIGCPSERILIELFADTTLSLTLEHHENMLHEVDVHDKHEQAINEQRLSVLTLDNSAAKSLAASVSGLAGVSMLGNGTDIGLPVVHGLSGNRLTLVNNGVVHTGQQWGADHSPEIDLNSASEVSVVSGAAAMRYPGTHMGGIVILESGPIPFDPHIHGKIRSTAESNGRGRTMNGQFYKGLETLQWRVGGTLKQYGDRHAPKYFLNNTGTRQAHANAELHKQWNNTLEWEGKYNYFSAEYGIMRGSHIGNLTDLESAFSREVPFFTDSVFSYEIEAPRQWVQHHQLKSGLKKHTELGTYEWHIAGQRDQRREYDVRRSGRSDIPALSLLQYSIQNEVLWSSELLETGYQFLGKKNWNLPETGIIPLLPNYTAFTNGAFIALDRAVRGYELEFGARYDYTFRSIAKLSNSVPRVPLYYDDNYHNFSFLGRISRNLGSKWQVLAETSLRQRPPEINEMYSFGLHQGVSGIEEGNLELDQETGLKSTLQLRGKVSEKLHVDVRAYTHFFDGYIYLQPQQTFRLTIRGAFPVFTYEQCDARLLGGDAVIKYEISEHLNFESTWGYVYGMNTTENLPLNFMPPLNVQNNLGYEVPQLKNWRNVNLSVMHRYTAQQWNWDSSLDLIAPPNSYHLFDLHLGATLKGVSFKPKFRVGIENIFNTSYRDYLNRQRYFADALGRNFTLSWVQNF
ncbi:MAG: TonB-dependent receptor [Schleiferiaceae bacterium]